MNQQLYEIIRAYEATGEQEQADRQVMLDFIAAFDDVTTRKNRFGHFTASPWIINEDATKVLMVYHRIYDSWSWCGGHLDGDFDPLDTAIREGKEESGLKELTALFRKPLALDVLHVPPHVRRGEFVSAHIHLNITYLCQAKESDALAIKPDENSGVCWFPIGEVLDAVREEDMKPVYEKLMHATKRLLSAS